MSPYARFNLRRNPFGELTRAERAELALVDVSPWLEALKRPETAVQFIGDSGHGKTTHLLALEHCLPEATYVYLPENGRHPTIPTRRPLLIDEAQRLGARQCFDVFRRGGPLALGTHEDLSVSLRRRGNFDIITVDVSLNHTPERLMLMLNRRIEASRVGRLSVPRIDCQYAEALLRQWGTNIRQIEQYLYDQFQDAVQKRSPWPPAN